MTAKIELRRATKTEQSFALPLPEYIEIESGKIGVLSANLDAFGSMLSRFTNFAEDLKTEEFKSTFEELLDALKYDTRYGNLLANRVRLAEYCWTKLLRMDGAETERYVARADLNNYSFLLCLIPGKSWNVICNCYSRELLDKYIKNFEDHHG